MLRLRRGWAAAALLLVLAAAALGTPELRQDDGGVGLFVLRGHRHRSFSRVLLHALSELVLENDPALPRIELHVMVTTKYVATTHLFATSLL